MIVIQRDDSSECWRTSYELTFFHGKTMDSLKTKTIWDKTEFSTMYWNNDRRYYQFEYGNII